MLRNTRITQALRVRHGLRFQAPATRSFSSSVEHRLETLEKNTDADNQYTVKDRLQTLERHLGSRYSWLDDDCDSISQRVKKLENTVKNAKMAIILVAVLGLYVYLRTEGFNRRVNYAVARALEARR